MHDDFDRFVSLLDPVALIVTATAGGERSGCLVGFHSQCSIEPPLLAVWLSRVNHTYRVAAGASHLGVHVLGERDRDLAELFGGTTGDEVDKFSRCAWHAGPHGVPLLDGCVHRGVFDVIERHDVGGDHELYVLAPTALDGGPDESVLRVSSIDVTPGHPVS